MPPSDFSGINPKLLMEMIKDLEQTKGLIEGAMPGLRDDFRRGGLDAGAIDKVLGVAGWIGGQTSMLRRRQALAEQLGKEQYQVGFGGGKVRGDDLGPFASQAEAQAKARELAAKYRRPGLLDDATWQEITKYQSDPDFAETFARALGPEKIGGLAGSNPERIPVIATILAKAGHRGVIDGAWVDAFIKGGGGTATHGLLGKLLEHGTWDTRTLTMIGTKAVQAPQISGGSHNTARILEAIARNPPAANAVYQANFDAINLMAYGRHTGWESKDKDPLLGRPLADFMKAATIDAAGVFAKLHPKGSNPGDELAMRLFGAVAGNHYVHFAYDDVDSAYTDIVGRFFKGTYIEELTGTGGLTWTDAIQITAGIVGIFDPTPASDAVDGFISLFKGDWKGAVLSAAAMIPYVGDLGAKPLKTFRELGKAYPGFKTLMRLDPELLKKVESAGVLDLSAGELKQLKEGLQRAKEGMENIVRVIASKGPDRINEALKIANSLHVDAAKIYARHPNWKQRVESLNLPTDGPIPFVPPRNWSPNRPAKEGRGFKDANGNIWVRGPGRGGQPYEWDVQVRSSLGRLSGDGKHLNVEWQTGRITHG